MSGIFYRNVRARDQLELFLLGAVSSLLLVRFYLHITGYPQIGSGGLHIAHMLWGGALMLVALVIALSFLGARAQRVTAFVGGIGFGVFIDELGKFITRDNNYFYQPTIGLIYAIFICLYLAFNFLSRSQPLTSRENQLNAVAQLEEALMHDLDPVEKARVEQFLADADQDDPVTKQLQLFLQQMKVIPAAPPSRARRLANRATEMYANFWQRRDSNLWVRGFFLLEATIFLIAVALTSYVTIDNILDLLAGKASFSTELAVGQLLSALAATVFVVRGVIFLPRSRMRAYEQFRRATLVHLFLTQFFMFAQIEFGALPSFAINLGLLGLITFAIQQERRLASRPQQ
jgi:hypothetical protein